MKDINEPYHNPELYCKNQSSMAWNQIKVKPSTSLQKSKTKPSNNTGPNSTALSLRAAVHTAYGAWAPGLYLVLAEGSLD